MYGEHTSPNKFEILDSIPGADLFTKLSNMNTKIHCTGGGKSQ